MNTVQVLVFAADPCSAPPDGRARRLLLDEDVRQMERKVRAAEYRNEVAFVVRWAARTDDLLQALNEERPQVVHFSGHGGGDGLVLVGKDGRPQSVDGPALAQLFTVFGGDIRVVVLNVCFSLPQAQAIAEAVGCAIGTRNRISDQAAITFGASFYRAIAFGHSVQAAFDQARTALALDHPAERDCPQMVVRPGVDPSRMILIQRDGAPQAQAPPGAGERTLPAREQSGSSGETRTPPRAREQAVPFAVRERYTPSGWMGDGVRGQTYVTVAQSGAEVNGRSMLVVKVTYAPGDLGWAGVYWQHPPDNWATEPGLDLRGAREVAFLARGEVGGEIVEFKSGGIFRGGPHPDSFEASLGSVVLAKEWRPYRIDLSREDLSNVVGAFAWIAAAADNGNRPMTFYLADLSMK